MAWVGQGRGLGLDLHGMVVGKYGVSSSERVVIIFLSTDQYIT